MRYIVISVLCCTILFSGCGPAIRIYSDYDKDADIRGLKQYGWLSEAAIEEKGLNPLYYNELNDKRIRQAVNRQLAAKGFVFSDTARTLVLHYHLVVESKTLSVNDVVPHNYNAYWLRRNASVYPYKEGSLIIDLMDNVNKTLVWRGWATGVIEDVVNFNPERAINMAVEKIFQRFPFTR